MKVMVTTWTDGGRDSPRHGCLRTAAWRRQSLYRRGQQPPLRRTSHGRTRHRRTAPPLGRVSREFLTWRRAGSGVGALTSTNRISFGASGALTTALTGVRRSSRPLGRRRESVGEDLRFPVWRSATRIYPVRPTPPE